MMQAPTQPISPAEQTDYGFATAMIDGARRARLACRGPAPLLAELMECAGGVAAATMNVQAGESSHADLELWCVKLAASALRLAREGDPGFPASLPQNAPAASDDVATFLTDCTIANPQHRVAADELYRAYSAWCARRGRAGRSCHGFLVRMSALGFLRSGVSIRFWNGLSLKPAAPAHAGEDAR